MSEDTKKTPEAESPETQAGPENAGKDEKACEKPREQKKDQKKEKKNTVTFTREEAEKLEHLAEELADTKDRHVRLLAEYDNYRKRTTKEKESIYGTARAETVLPFLAIYDNLERALKSGEESDSPHKKGMEMIFTQLKEILEKLGVTEMEAEGKPFDPERHNAVMHVEDETLGENVVAEVFQKGFMIGDRVLRFAVVKVAN
jgi:molecular chaperone GrpE